MDITNSLRPEDISKSDFFDFVVTADANEGSSIHSFGRSMKSLGIYLEAYETNNNTSNNNNNNNNSTSNNNNSSNTSRSLIKEEGDRLHLVEQNNNQLMVANGSNQDYMVHSPYWNGPAISSKDDPASRWESSVLEDLNCWSQDGSGSSKHLAEGENTDGAIYTLTVLNGSDQSSSWYRIPESVQDDESPSPHPQGVPSSHVQGSLDLDSLINNIIPSPLHQASGSSFSFHPTTSSRTQDVSGTGSASETTTCAGGGESPAIKSEEFSYESRFSDGASGLNHQRQIQQSFNNGGNGNNSTSNNSISTSIGNTSVATTSAVSVGSPNINCNTNSNSNDWSSLASGSTSQDTGVDSLLRSALQGKSSTSFRYNGVAHNHLAIKVEKDNASGDKETDVHYQDVIGNVKTHSPVMCAVSLETGTVVMLDGNSSGVPGSMLIDNDNPNTVHSVDDIFLSHLDSVTYAEDYEKLKSIENEVANSMEQYCNPYLTTHLGDPVRMSPLPHLDHTITLNSLPTTTTATTTVTSKSAKKYKRSSSSSSSSKSAQGHQIQTAGVSSGGIRKERSLHYCNICSKGFKDKYSVNVHIRTHTGEKPFTCTLCGKSFRQKAHLAKHYHTHLAQAKNPPSSGSSGGVSKPSNNKSR